MRNVYIAKSEHGRLSLGSELNKALFKQDLKEHPNATYRIERVVHKRTPQQNRYMWLYFEICERDTGNDKHALHDYCVKYLTPKKEVILTLYKDGKPYTMKGMTGKGTSELNKIEMADMLDKLSMDTGVPLPNPEEAGYILN